MKNISLKLPEELNAALEQLAKQRGVAKSDIVRDAIEAYLADPTNGARISCLDLVRDLAGSIDGPHDLASNPKYMRGFGR